MLDEVVLAREAIATLPRAVLDGTVAEDGVVDAGLVALQVCEAGEGLAAVVAAEGLSWSGEMLVGALVQIGEEIAYLDAGAGESALDSYSLMG